LYRLAKIIKDPKIIPQQDDTNGHKDELVISNLPLATSNSKSPWTVKKKRFRRYKNNTLVALAVAQSLPDQRGVIIRFIINLIKGKS
jgi:hypothetical protein